MLCYNQLRIHVPHQYMQQLHQRPTFGLMNQIQIFRKTCTHLPLLVRLIEVLVVGRILPTKHENLCAIVGSSVMMMYAVEFLLMMVVHLVHP